MSCKFMNMSEIVLVTAQVKVKNGQHLRGLLVVDYSRATESDLVYHITCLDPLCSSFRMTLSDLELIRTL